MYIKTKITMNVAKQGITPLIYAMQGDQHSRSIEITLTSDGVPWSPPEGASVQVGYTGADGAQLTYTKLSNGNDAGSIAGNVVSVTIAPQALTRPGKIPMTVTLISGDTQISTFPVMLQVTARPGYGGGQGTGGETGGGSQDGSCNITEEYINSLIDAKLAEFTPAAPTYTVEVEVT